MGFWDNVLATARAAGSEFFSPRVTYLPAGELQTLVDPGSLTPAQMWRTQPHLRTVVSFLARNIAQLGLHTFTMVDAGDRQRDRTSAVARTLRDVDGSMTRFELIYALVGDLALYDRAYWFVGASTERASGFEIRRLPPAWVTPVMENPWKIKHYAVIGGKEPIKVPTENVLVFPGYDPSSMFGSSPTIDSLKDILEEQIAGSRYRKQVWKNGGRVSAVLQRPVGAPPWSSDAREAFREDWYAKYTGRGPRVGGTPILEDGMTLHRVDFSAHDQQYVEAAKLSLSMVAAAFHVNPTMIGQNDGANYSNVREFRKMLYGDTLGPTLALIEDRLNTFFIPRVGGDNERTYVEFNIEEKLQGNFEEQTTALQAATGAPWMTRNEARSIRNLPSIDGGDELVTPLNVLLGGQASPRDSGSQNRTGSSSRPVLVKEQAPESFEAQSRRVFEKFFQRQARVILSHLGAKADWWDQARWDEELADDLLRLAVAVSKQVAGTAADGLGFDAEDYDVTMTINFLKKVTSRIAGQVNTTTYIALLNALDEDDPGEAVKHVFEIAETSRAEQSGLTLVTTVAGFATAEAGKQLLGAKAMKRWIVNSSNPRPSHAALNGEEVTVDEPFSNGLMWPGSFDGDVDEVAGCQCSIEVFAS